MLMGAGAWEIVNGTELEPAPANNARHRDDIKDFKKRSQLALAMIWSSISPGLQSYVQGKINPSDMWASLIAHMDVVKNENGATLLR